MAQHHHLGLHRHAQQPGSVDAVLSDVRCPVKHSRVAIIIRGHAFRGAATAFTSSGPSELSGCSPYADTEEQEQSTKSLLDNLIVPLEAPPCRNKVHVVATECSQAQGCPLLGKIVEWLGSKRVIATQSKCASTDQSHNIKLALDLFSGLFSSSNMAESVPFEPKGYGLVIVTRHDIVWTSRITNWPGGADYSRLLFLSGCEPRCLGCIHKHCHRCMNVTGRGSRFGGEPHFCVQDTLHMMPGSLFPAFHRAVGSKGSRCFDGFNKHGGHSCFNILENRTGPTGLVLPLNYWRPFHNVREPTPISTFQQQSMSTPRGIVSIAGTTVSTINPAGGSGRGGGVQTGLPCYIAPELRAQLPLAIARRMCGQKGGNYSATLGPRPVARNLLGQRRRNASTNPNSAAALLHHGHAGGGGSGGKGMSHIKH